MTNQRDKGEEMDYTGKDRKQGVLVDDHPIIAKGLGTLFRTTPDLSLAAEARTTAEALTLIEKINPAFVLLDISLPGSGGLEFLKDLNVLKPRLPVVVLSMHDENVYAERALRAGARGYVMKQEPGEKVVAAIRCVLDGGVYISSTLTTRLLSRLAPGGVPEPTGADTLNDRELQVYSLIGNGMATQKIALQLNLSPKTVQTYREHIKRKLGLRTATELVHSATRWIREKEHNGC